MSVQLSRATFRVLGLAMLLASTLSHAQDITIAVGGDAIGGPYQPVTPQRDARFEQVMAILKGADAAFANQEGSVFDLAGFSGSVGAEDGGGHPLCTAFQESEAAQGLRAVTSVNYRGFVFARLASTGPDFESYFGESLTSIDNMVDRSPEGRLEMAGGVLRYGAR
jgi:hypothetical protein